jgi:hypothetical protein
MNMNVIEITFGLKDADKAIPSLEIVWRNPDPVPTRWRRHSFEDSGYIVQELVDDGQAGRWAKLAKWEVAVGGRAA